VAAVAVATYGVTLRGGFVYDDHWTIEDNPAVVRPDGLRLLQAGRLGELPGEPALEADLRWRPVMVASNWIDYRIAGDRPLFHHADSLLVYLACSLLVLALGRSLGLSREAALFGALFFAAHPLHAEVVAAVNYREDLLATAFGIAAFLLFRRARARPSRGGRVAITVAAMLCLIVGLNAKATAAVVPALLVLYDLVLLPAEPLRARVRRVGLGWAAAAAALVGSRQVLDLFGGYRPHGYDAPQMGGLFHMLSVQAAIWFEYARQTLVPVGLSADYLPVDELPGFALRAVAGALGSAALVAWAVWARRREPRAVFLIGWAALALLPTCVFVGGPSPRADRHTFFASAALALLAAGALRRALAGVSLGRRGSAVLASALVVALGVAGFRQALVWRDDATLWKATALRSTSSPRAHVAWMGIELDAGRPARAAAIGRRALERWPHNWQLHEQLGLASARQDDYAKALGEYRQATRDGGDQDPGLLSKLGHAQFETGDLAGAVRTYRTAITLQPNMPLLYLNLGRIFALSGQPEQAEPPLRRALELAPSDEALRWHARVLERLGRPGEARSDFEALLRLLPGDPEAARALGR
jgi:Flp pilus assembly protein TadD